jgi:hypothetical protein
MRGSAEKDHPKINAYTASNDLEYLSKNNTLEEIMKYIGLGMNGYILFSFLR